MPHCRLHVMHKMMEALVEVVAETFSVLEVSHTDRDPVISNASPGVWAYTRSSACSPGQQSFYCIGGGIEGELAR